VIHDYTLESGVVWSLPIVLDADPELANEVKPNGRVGIRAPDGSPADVMDVQNIYWYNKTTCQQFFGTTDTDHPEVRKVQSMGSFLLRGPVTKFADADSRIGSPGIAPKEARVPFNKRG
jgi:sulfate adenylyltransferase